MTRAVTLRTIAFVLSMGLVACSSSQGGSDASMDFAQAAAPSCPITRPASGAPCDSTLSCAYLNCAADCGSDSGRILATCSCRGCAWLLHTRPCGSFRCGAGLKCCAEPV